MIRIKRDNFKVLTLGNTHVDRAAQRHVTSSKKGENLVRLLRIRFRRRLLISGGMPAPPGYIQLALTDRIPNGSSKFHPQWLPNEGQIPDRRSEAYTERNPRIT